MLLHKEWHNRFSKKLRTPQDKEGAVVDFEVAHTLLIDLIRYVPKQQTRLQRLLKFNIVQEQVRTCVTISTYQEAQLLALIGKIAPKRLSLVDREFSMDKKNNTLKELKVRKHVEV